MDDVTLYRCAACGKWSHAKRKPPHHKRLVRGVTDDDGNVMTGSALAAREGLRVLEVHDEQFGTTWGPIANEEFRIEPKDDWYEPEGATVACGPFETWVATRD